MPHNLESNKKYKLVTVTVAIPEDTPHHEADILNEILSPAVAAGEIADYTLYGMREVTMAETAEDPEEGCLFPIRLNTGNA